ncbi:MAG: nickel-dependent hydrogenase large subunit [Desulfovibrionaceae bacterium]|jgi:Ni,Fe-hydrogenase III large subunit|nr:nickel-dependent hydrogenase large subunit [Desulfovibrionaceae bacterium]
MNRTTEKTYALPIGPVHVALEEPMYYKIELDGEIVRGVELTAGHVHRGMEALALRRNLFQNIVLTERVCSLCSNSHPYTYCMSVENLADIAVPPRAQCLRVVAEEIKRISSHLFNVGVMAHVIGYNSLFMHMMQQREIMQDVKETLYGNRMNLSANCIGGVTHDLEAEAFAFLLDGLARLEPEVARALDIYRTDRMVVARTRSVGVLSREDALALAVVGPVARGSGLATDIRRDAPYGAYVGLDVDVVVEQGGDVQSRALVRLREIQASIDLLRACVRAMPAGPTLAVLPEIPAGQAIARSEAPRGELIYYLRTDGSQTPNRLKWRVPSYMNWDALGIMLRNAKVSDIPLIVNSIDPCISCTER